MRHKITVVILLCVMLSGCAQGSTSDNSAYTTPTVSAERTEPSESAPDETSSSESETGEAPASTEPTEISSSDDTGSTSESNTPLISEPTEQTTTEPTEPPESTPPVAETSPPRTTTEATTETTTAATTAVTTAKPPVPVVIPNIVDPSSPSISVITADNGAGIIDYSNTSEGYISVNYTGAAPKVKLRLVKGDITYNHDVPIDGKTHYFPLSCGSGDYSVFLYENAGGNMYSVAAEGTFSASIKSETSPFTYSNYYIEYDKNSACVKKGAELCAGAAGDIEKIAAIFSYVTENVTYDRQLAATVQSGYVPNPDKTLKLKTGICFDYASLFAAMTRSQGIPTRLCVGYAATDIYHAWNEVYTPETGWITPELFLKNKGYNLVDATFYAGASDKKQISEYISKNSNYSVIYYY